MWHVIEYKIVSSRIYIYIMYIYIYNCIYNYKHIYIYIHTHLLCKLENTVDMNGPTTRHFPAVLHLPLKDASYCRVCRDLSREGHRFSTRSDPLSRESRHCGTRNWKICRDRGVSTVTAAGWVQLASWAVVQSAGSEAVLQVVWSKKPRFNGECNQAKQHLQNVHSFKSVWNMFQ